MRLGVHRVVLFLVALSPLPIAIACASSSATSGTDAATASCYQVWERPGCGPEAPAPVCFADGGACLAYVCSCRGTVLVGCGAFGEPFTSYDRLGPDAQPGDPCAPYPLGDGGDAAADAGG